MGDPRGLRIAKQNIEQNANESWVSWNHVNPGSNSFVETYSDTSIRVEERDPDGAEMGTEDPLANVVEPPTYENLKGEEPLYIEGGDPYNYSGSLTIDGLPVSQAEFNRRMQNGSAGVQVSVGGRPMVFVTNQQQLQHITFDVFEVDNELKGRPQRERWGGTNYRGMIDGNLSFTGPAPFVPTNPQNPQNTVRNVGPILDKIRFLGDKANDKNLRSMLQVRLMQLLSKSCADAFKRAGLATPEEIINKGITIADRPLFDDSSNNETLGLSAQTQQFYSKNSQADALTIRAQFTSKGPIIFFRAAAYADSDYFDEAVAHEFIHAAGIDQFSLWGYRLGRGHDLSAYDHYQDIIDNCGYKNVVH